MSRPRGMRKRNEAEIPLILAVAFAVSVGAGGISAEAAMRFGSFAGLTALVDAIQLVEPASQLDLSIEDIEGVAGDDLPVTIKLPPPAEMAGAVPGTFILIRNMPAGVRLSAGMSSGRLWALPLHDVAGLRLLSEPNAVGDFALEFSLIGPDNRVLTRKIVTLNLKQFDISERVGTTGVIAVSPDRFENREPPPTPRPAPPPSGTTIGLAEEKALLERGQKFMSQGGIVAARIIFEELARMGSAKGALALARSYDPLFAQNSRASGVAMDLGRALEWYGRAEALGSIEARARIAEIAPPR